MRSLSFVMLIYCCFVALSFLLGAGSLLSADEESTAMLRCPVGGMTTCTVSNFESCAEVLPLPLPDKLPSVLARSTSTLPTPKTAGPSSTAKTPLATCASQLTKATATGEWRRRQCCTCRSSACSPNRTLTTNRRVRGRRIARMDARVRTVTAEE